MIIVLSPAKTLDFETPAKTAHRSQPSFLDESAALIDRLRKVSTDDLAGLMSLSPALAELNVERYQTWSRPFNVRNAKQAVLAFNGDVYEGLDAASLDEAALNWAQSHLRILSGLYGVLRPLDLIQPYRLEMGTRLDNARGKDLYRFWGERLIEAIGGEIRSHRHPILVNLASNEYFKALPRASSHWPVIQPVFQEQREDGWKVISFMAKRARGLMARYAVEQRLEDPEGLKEFGLEGYTFHPETSDASLWVFRRG